MPRQARLDAPNIVHHVLARGVARGPIVRDDIERQALVKDLGELLGEAEASCFAWCLMSTHLHLVIRTGRRPLHWIMHRLLLRHAQRVNSRWGRVGHVFQNRYKSLLVDQDTYLLALIRYVHLNPWKAGVVPSLAALSDYPWCGHGALVGTRNHPWMATAEALALFHRSRSHARKLYRAWVARRTRDGSARTQAPDQPEVSFLAYEDPVSVTRESDGRSRDGRILGGGAFVARIHRELGAEDRRRRLLKSRISPAEVVHRAAEVVGVTEASLYSRDRRRPVTDARAVASSWLIDELGMRVVDVAALLRVTSPSICVAVVRGRRLIEHRKLRLDRGSE